MFRSALFLILLVRNVVDGAARPEVKVYGTQGPHLTRREGIGVVTTHKLYLNI